MEANTYRKSLQRNTARTMGLAALALGLMIAARPAAAHHSFSMFDFEKEVTISGTVKAFDWTNPHTFTWIDVTDSSGKVTEFGIEGMSPNYLGRRGWTKNTLKPGDKVSVVIHPLKDGQNGGTFLRCTLADGSEMFMFGSPGQ